MTIWKRPNKNTLWSKLKFEYIRMKYLIFQEIFHQLVSLYNFKEPQEKYCTFYIFCDLFRWYLPHPLSSVLLNSIVPIPKFCVVIIVKHFRKFILLKTNFDGMPMIKPKTNIIYEYTVSIHVFLILNLIMSSNFECLISNHKFIANILCFHNLFFNLQKLHEEQNQLNKQLIELKHLVRPL